MNIDGTDSDDDLAGSTGIDLIFGFGGNDTIRGSASGDTLHGGDGNDLVYGGTGNDRLFGGAGNDTLSGSVAPDESPAGEGEWNAAVYDFSSWTTSVVFPDYPPSPFFLPPDQIPDGQGGIDTLVAIHQLEIYGGSAADHLSGVHLQTGLAGFTFVEGNGGDDIIGRGAGASTIAFDTARRDLGVDRLHSLASGDRILLRNFDFDLGKALSAGDGATVSRGEVQFSYDAATNLTRVSVGADEVAGADVMFDVAGQLQLSQFSRNDAGSDAYLVLDGGATDPVRPDQPVTLVGTAGDDNLAGGGGNDSISGAEKNDVLAGGAGDDTLRGEGGNDHLNGGAGNDLLDGGADYDAAVYDFTASTTAVWFTGTLDTGATRTQADGLGGTDTLVDVETLEIFGGSADDTLTGSSGIDFLEGGAGNDVLTGGAGVDTYGFETRSSDLGVDLITDYGAGDRIRLRHLEIDFFTPITVGDGAALNKGQVQLSEFDQASNTTLLYVGTDDAAGADLTIRLQGTFNTESFVKMATYFGTTFYSELQYGQPPAPPLEADRPQTWFGSAEGDTYTGASANDSLDGAGGNDTIMGMGGDDLIDGGYGNDKLYGGDGHDTVLGGIGGRDRLEGGAGNDLLSGGDGDDMIWGDDGNDRIEGGIGNDRLTGGAGDDFLYGGAGTDTLVGNAGVDTFFFDSGSGSDRIDFFWVSHKDRIRIQSDVNGSGIRSAQDAYARTTDTADGALVDLGGGNTVLLTGVHLNAISAAIFEVV